MRLALIVILALVAPARADSNLYAGEALPRPPIEWSSWIRAAVGLERAREDAIARGTAAASTHTAARWELGLGVEGSLALSPRGDVRIGAWSELRGISRGDAFAGGELVLTRVPRRVDMFFYEGGQGTLAVRAGRSTTSATASIAYGYLAPFHLEGECKERFFGIVTGHCRDRPLAATRYMSSLRVVATVTRALDDPRAWSATIGFEFEPVAALRMLLVARSWY